jgi:hypothetical protein
MTSGLRLSTSTDGVHAAPPPFEGQSGGIGPTLPLLKRGTRSHVRTRIEEQVLGGSLA